jgi:signal peptidase I
VKIRKIQLLLLLPLLISTFSFGRAEQKPQWKGSITKEGDVIVVKNPKEPLYSEPILSLKEEFSIGGAEAKGDYILSNPRSIAVDGNENIFILDLKEPVLRAFDKSGKYVKTIGRSGQGPGELSGAFAMTLLPEKNEIYVYEVSNRRIPETNTGTRHDKRSQD